MPMSQVKNAAPTGPTPSAMMASHCPDVSGQTVVSTMLADPEVRLPGARRFAAEKSAKGGIEVPDDLLAQIEKLCST